MGNLNSYRFIIVFDVSKIARFIGLMKIVIYWSSGWFRIKNSIRYADCWIRIYRLEDRFTMVENSSLLLGIRKLLTLIEFLLWVLSRSLITLFKARSFELLLWIYTSKSCLSFPNTKDRIICHNFFHITVSHKLRHCCFITFYYAGLTSISSSPDKYHKEMSIPFQLSSLNSAKIDYSAIILFLMELFWFFLNMGTLAALFLKCKKLNIITTGNMIWRYKNIRIYIIYIKE